MQHCYFCDQDVAKFKTQSHVIPKTLFKNVKDSGKMVLLDYQKKTNRYTDNVNKELIGDFICDTCEQQTGRDDRFSDNFFNQNRYLLSKEPLEKNILVDREPIQLVAILNFQTEALAPFKLFIISIILRYYCYLRICKQIEGLPAHHISALRQLYHSKNEKQIAETYPIIMLKNSISSLVTYPYYQRLGGISTQALVILGYEIHLFVDKRHEIPKNLQLTHGGFRCVEIAGTTRWHKELWKSHVSHKTVGTLKEHLTNGVKNA